MKLVIEKTEPRLNEPALHIWMEYDDQDIVIRSQLDGKPESVRDARIFPNGEISINLGGNFRKYVIGLWGSCGSDSQIFKFDKDTLGKD